MSKDDPNYVAKLERAIAEKYGAETVSNPKGGWTDEKEKEYLQQLKEMAAKERRDRESQLKVEVNGVLIPKKLLNKDSKRTCTICNVYSFRSMDDVYQVKFGCCFKCYVQHIEEREERWESGWRPKQGTNE